MDYLTSDQVAVLLQVSVKSIYRWAAGDPTMPALRIGGTVRFNRDRLERWLRDREQGRPRSPKMAATGGARL
jgi:excisionase family DNA binding protein